MEMGCELPKAAVALAGVIIATIVMFHTIGLFS